MIFRSMAIAAVLCIAATLSLPAAAKSDVLGSCRLQCDQKLSSCEHDKGVHAKCPRKHQACLQDCSAPPKVERRNRAEKRRDICTQKCDLNYATCQQANSDNDQQCRAGQQSCTDRCQ